MPYLVIKSASNATPESYQLTNTWEKPRLAVKTQKTSTSSYSYPVTTTVLTSSSNSEGMSNTTALTCASTFDTIYYTEVQTTNTVYDKITDTFYMFAAETTVRYSYTTGPNTKYYTLYTSCETDGFIRSVSGNSYYADTGSWVDYGEDYPIGMTTSISSSKGIGESVYTSSTTSAVITNDILHSFPYEVSTATNYLTAIVTTNTQYLTRSSVYGYSGILSSSSESASTTCYTDVSSLYLPLSTDTSGAGLKVKDSGNTYRVMRTTTVSSSQSASATFLTNAVDSAGLSNTTALTRESTSATYTRASTSGTNYGTKVGTYFYAYGTEVSMTRSSAYGQGNDYWGYYKSSVVTGYCTSTRLATGRNASGTYTTEIAIFGNINGNYASYNVSGYSGAGGGNRYSTYVGSYPIQTTSIAMKQYQNGYNNSWYSFAYIYNTFNNSTSAITTGTTYLTRSSISGYGTRSSISGYSGISSSSSSESASTTSWG